MLDEILEFIPRPNDERRKTDNFVFKVVSELFCRLVQVVKKGTAKFGGVKHQVALHQQRLLGIFLGRMPSTQKQPRRLSLLTQFDEQLDQGSKRAQRVPIESVKMGCIESFSINVITMRKFEHSIL